MEQLRQILKNKGITQKKVANLLGVSLRNFQKKLNGSVGITAEELKIIAEEYDLMDLRLSEIIKE